MSFFDWNMSLLSDTQQDVKINNSKAIDSESLTSQHYLETFRDDETLKSTLKDFEIMKPNVAEKTLFGAELDSLDQPQVNVPQADDSVLNSAPAQPDVQWSQKWRTDLTKQEYSRRVLVLNGSQMLAGLACAVAATFSPEFTKFSTTITSLTLSSLTIVATSATLLFHSQLKKTKLWSSILLALNTVAFALIIGCLTILVAPEVVITILAALALSCLIFLTSTASLVLTLESAKLFGIAAGIVSVVQLSIMIPLACLGYFQGWFMAVLQFIAVGFMFVTMVDHYILDKERGHNFIVTTLRYFVSFVVQLIIVVALQCLIQLWTVESL